MPAVLLGCGYSRHQAPFASIIREGLPHYLFRLQTEGSASALVDGNMTKIAAGSLLLYRAGEPYELRLQGKDENGVDSADYYLFCKGSWIDEWWARTDRPQHTRIDADERIVTLWRQLMFENRRVQEEADQELLGCLLQALCLCLDRAIRDASLGAGRSFPVQRMKRYIEENAAAMFKIADVARHAGLSVSRAVHLFRESCGTTMMKYALEVRLSMAVERMKHTTMTLDQIADNCGFGSYPYFHRAFKSRYGMAPKAYRGTAADGAPGGSDDVARDKRR
ncbi:MAG: helix-turn-helix transcriptional regulator [Paenibacillaceae bacterium]|nr:helix-turn-helix transcriptional regulator [Paenibacillaceae bacterium]